MHHCKWLGLIALLVQLAASERVNHEGRDLGKPVPVTQPILFNTPEADAVLSSMQIFPKDSPWNEDISQRPLLPNSEAMIAQIICGPGLTAEDLARVSRDEFCSGSRQPTARSH